jgi:glutathione synthase/RimK-type ligase-like ATP-grasp enzyme
VERDSDFGAVALAPVTFQEEVPKRSDLRVTVVGSTCFAVSIESQAQPDTTTDWRRPAAMEPALEFVTLPTLVQERCSQVLRALKLTFGAIDLVHSLSGQYVFLEVNPTGQWGWLEVQLGLPISSSIAAALAEGPA